MPAIAPTRGSTATVTEGSTTRYLLADGPIGPLLITADERGLTRVHMELQRHVSTEVQPSWVRDDAGLAEAAKQFAAYFAGELREFDLELNPAGTPFQLKVWDALRTIPYGETASYGELAAQIGQPTAARAVGMANGRNPIAVIVPCHRVIGASGSLVGYGGGLERKRFLLDLERRTLGAGQDTLL